jgi:hypothetical protein
MNYYVDNQSVTSKFIFIIKINTTAVLQSYDSISQIPNFCGFYFTKMLIFAPDY